jgi:hypothetical protein
MGAGLVLSAPVTLVVLGVAASDTVHGRRLAH